LLLAKLSCFSIQANVDAQFLIRVARKVRMGKKVERALRVGAPQSATSRTGDDCCKIAWCFILYN